jgi:hypothetical protein
MRTCSVRYLSAIWKTKTDDFETGSLDARKNDRSDSAQPDDQVSELPKAKKFEVKIDRQLRPVSRASANPAAEKVSKAIETINKNKITRQPLSDSNANSSKRTSIESKRQSMDENKRHSVGANMRSSVDIGNRNLVDTHNVKSSLDISKRNSVDMHNKRHSVDTTKKTPVEMHNKRHSVDGSNGRSEIHKPEGPRPSSMAHIQVRGGPQKPLAVMESAGYTPQRNSMLDVHSAGMTQHRNSMLDLDIRGGPQKAIAVAESAEVAKEQLQPLAMNPVQIRGGPQKPMAIMDSARQARESSTSTSESFAPVEVRGGPQKQASVLASARHARESSKSSIASNRHSVGDIEQLMQKNDAANKQSHPPLGTRRSFSEGSAPAEEQAQSQNTSLARKPSGRKTAERLAWIRELEEGNKASGNHGRDYMFNKLQGGVRDKLAKFENKQLTGGLARTDSNISRRLSTSSDAYSIEQPALNRLSRTSAIDDDFRKKLEESVGNQHKKRIIPQEVLDLVALTDGDQEAALNDFMENWNQDELIKQINDAADEAMNGGKKVTKDEVKTNDEAVTKPIAKEVVRDAGAADFDPFGPGADLSLGKPTEKKQTSDSTSVGLPKVPSSELPKPSKTWNPKPMLKSEPTRKNSVGSKSTSVASATTSSEAKPSWIPKIASKHAESSSSEEAKKETPAPAPAVSKVPTSLLPGNFTTGSGSSWNPKPSSTWNPKPSSGWNPKPAAKPMPASNVDEAKTAPKGSTVAPTSSKAASSSSMVNGASAGGAFTAAALPRFVTA